MKFKHEPFDSKKHNEFLLYLLEINHIKTKEAFLDFIPPTGFVVYEVESGFPICMGWTIICDNGMAINTDLMSDKGIAQPERSEAVDYLRLQLALAAKAKGARLVTAFTKHKKLANKMAKKGFVYIDSGLIQMGRLMWL